MAAVTVTRKSPALCFSVIHSMLQKQMNVFTFVFFNQLYWLGERALKGFISFFSPINYPILKVIQSSPIEYTYINIIIILIYCFNLTKTIWILYGILINYQCIMTFSNHRYSRKYILNFKNICNSFLSILLTCILCMNNTVKVVIFQTAW